MYVKVPATPAGIEAIRVLTSEGIPVNVTLIFSLDRYADVIEAYLSGLEAHQGGLSHISSVGSFFISRVDTEVDRRLQEIGTNDALDLMGTAAITQGKLAYQLAMEAFSGPRWGRSPGAAPPCNARSGRPPPRTPTTPTPITSTH